MKLSFVKKHISKVDSRYIPLEEEDLFDVRRFLPDYHITPDPKTITWITNSYLHRTLGGSEYVSHTMNKFLIEKGYTVNVIGNWDTDIYEGVQLINVRDLHKIKEAVGKCSILMAQNYIFPELTAKIAGRLNKHAVIVIHTTKIDWDPPPYIYQNYIPKDKLHIIYNTEWVQKHFNTSLHSMVVRPPIGLTKLTETSTRKYVTLITTTAHKGGYQLVEIAKKMSDILFLGVGNHGIQDKTIPNIVYIPNTRNIREVYDQTDILLMPSEYESWGMVGSEAISSGIPVIASPTPGLQENLAYAGLFIPQNSIDEWVQMIRKLKTDSEFYEETVAKCLNRGNELQAQNIADFENMVKFIDDIAQM